MGEISKEQINAMADILSSCDEKKFSWSAQEEKLPSFVTEKIGSLKGKTEYDKNSALKEKLKDCFNEIHDEDRKMDLAKWIIKDWGRISSFNEQKIKNDFQLDEEEIKKISLKDSISSRSKVFSFRNPDKFAICDSRNIFTLNWLIFFSANDIEQIQLFKDLPGRNTIIPNYNLATVMNLFVGKKSNVKYTNYGEFNDMLKELGKALKCKKLYEIEMKLFSFSNANEDNGIFKYIRDNLENHIKQIKRH